MFYIMEQEVEQKERNKKKSKCAENRMHLEMIFIRTQRRIYELCKKTQKTKIALGWKENLRTKWKNKQALDQEMEQEPAKAEPVASTSYQLNPKPNVVQKCPHFSTRHNAVSSR